MDPSSPIERTTFTDLFEETVAAAFDKQLAFADIVGSANWSLSMDEGRIDFGEQRSYPVQIIGTESAVSNTWMWGWANEASNLPPVLLQDVLRLQSVGQTSGVSELITPMLPLSDKIDGHHISCIASVLCEADAYYRCPYDGGALFVTVYDVATTSDASHPTIHIATVFPQVISAFAIANHRRALASYLISYHFAVEDTGSGLRGTDTSGHVIEATFDEWGRLQHISTQAQPIR